ncbi:MAG: hypothetical protein Q9216_004191, partial [Gyalolechia sp. 2 TL-2023]
MAPSPKEKAPQAKKTSDAPEGIGGLSEEPSIPTTPQSLTRRSESAFHQSSPVTPQRQTAGPISRTSSGQTPESTGYATVDPVAAFNLIRKDYIDQYHSRNLQRNRTPPKPSYRPPSFPPVQATPTHQPGHRQRAHLDTSDSALFNRESPLSRLQADLASYKLLPNREPGSMDPNLLAPGPAPSSVITKQKERTTQIAKEQQAALSARLMKNNLEMPPFEFLELIGKGAFGRVFKANDLNRNKVVALKVVDVDPHDFKVHYLEKDESIQTVLHEIKILTQLRDSNARNINLIIDAFSIHSQLWIVTEYCPGGSLHTLMQGVGSKLEERYIIPVARELAIALKAIHAAGIIHRDVKAANVMIHENGSLQLIDFGVAGLLQTSKDKRSTIIGTPHWMAPEMSSQLVNQGPSTVDYATEIDVWAYGCTLYEIATGNPPYHRAVPGRKLTMMLKRGAPTLKEKDFSDGLVGLVDYIMKTSPEDRPPMDSILQHTYLLDTEEKYPTRLLADLVKMYYRWEYSGGQRVSLFMPGGAEAAAFPTIGDDDGEWNFSTTMNFDAQNTYLAGQQQPAHLSNLASKSDSDLIPRYNAPTHLPPSSNHPASAFHKPKSSLNFSFSMSSSPGMDDSTTPMPNEGVDVTITTPHGAAAAATTATGGNVERGEKSLRAIFDPSAPDYQYGGDSKSDDHLQVTSSTNQAEALRPSLDRSKSDLPLRNAASGVAVHKEVDKSGFVKTPSIDLSSVNTIKANRMNRSGHSLDKPGSDDNEGSFKRMLDSTKRATMEWTFATAQEAPAAKEAPVSSRLAQRDTLDWSFANAGTVEEEPEEETLPVRPALRHMATAPVGVMDPRPKSVLDLDELWESELTYDSSALNTAPASDDEAFAAYDLSDANEPATAPTLGPAHPSILGTRQAEGEEAAAAAAAAGEEGPATLSGAPHPYSSLRAPAKLKSKMLKAFVYQLNMDPELADRVVTGDGADPHNLEHGNEDFALECVEEYIAQNHSTLPVHLRMAMRRDIMDARVAIFTKYLGGDYPFEKYYGPFDMERMGEEYESDGVHSPRSTVYEFSSDEEEDEDEDEDDGDPMPRLTGVNVAALAPGATDEALHREFVTQVDQYANRVLPWAQRKLERMALEVGEGEEGEEGEFADGAGNG